ncbi:MAG TPA: sugar transferase [Methylocella sp.]|nr:sugar transferase [Methylocella sp.]
MSASRSAGSTAIARPSAATLALKRAVDAVGSVAGLLILSPLFLAVAIAIKLDSAGPIFFRQERVGRGGRLFRIFKFRSMIADAPQVGPEITVRADSRVTRVGRFLRKSKLDEFPQLINVLRGEMSLVGPRPEVPRFIKYYTPDQRAIMLSLRPGMTDYAAILFRDESSLLDGKTNVEAFYRREIMPIKFSYYERYSYDVSLRNDLRIIIATVCLLIFKRIPGRLGIEHEPRLTKPR